jgi:hypothetical protein
VRFDIDDLLNRYQITHRAKAPVADTANDEQMLSTSERPVFFAMFDDSFSQALSDSRQPFQLFG